MAFSPSLSPPLLALSRFPLSLSPSRAFFLSLKSRAAAPSTYQNGRVFGKRHLQKRPTHVTRDLFEFAGRRGALFCRTV